MKAEVILAEQPSVTTIDRLVSVAPMMEWTTRHTRYFLRLINPRILLYTEMVTTAAMLHGDRSRFLAHDRSELPLAIQLGGSEPRDLARCSEFAERAGFDEINLNVGCPSDRVQSGRFGACLMLEPERVRDCVSAMKSATALPVTVKCRLGVDNLDDYEFLHHFISVVAESGCTTFIVHARKAILRGLSPKQNREIPPLHYDRVYRLKREFADFEIVINGGVRSLDEVLDHLYHVDGVMIGREAFGNPWMLGSVADALLGGRNCATPEDLLENYRPYIKDQLDSGVALRHLTAPLMGLFHGRPGARAFRRHLSEYQNRRGAGLEVVDDAADKLINPVCV